MTTTTEREKILDKRIESERNGLLKDIALWKASIPQGTVIHHHIQQFEQLSNWMMAQLKGSFRHRPDRWPNLDQRTFNSLIISVLSGKWILLRQVVQQRSAGSPYLNTLQELDGFAEDCYRRLSTVLQSQDFKVKGLSESSPLVCLGPIARLFLFDEEAPCLISAPFGAANTDDAHGQELCRQTIPHEVGHAIFEQVSGLLDELKFKVASEVKHSDTKKQGLIRSVILNWLEEIVADIAGTALAGLPFAESASEITIMPDRLIGITDGEHPIPLLRSFVHAWVLEQLDPADADPFKERLAALTDDHIKKPFESLPAVIPVTMQEVKKELLVVVESIWNCPLDVLNQQTLGKVFGEVFQAPAPPRRANDLPDWGNVTGRSDEVIFRLVGPLSPTSALPGLPLFLDSVCCPLKLQFCCSHTII
jgi:hypothetical protein